MKEIHLLVITLFTVLQLAAQPVITKQALFAGTASQSYPHMAMLKNGGVVMVISSSSNASGNKSENNRDSTGLTFDYWVVKVNASGKIEWDKTFGGNKNEFATSVVATRDGDYIVAGYSYSGVSGDKTAPSKGTGTDLWIVKIDSLGNKIWDKAYGGSSDEYGGSIMEINDGFILGGISYSGISGDKTKASRGFGDYWVLKLNKQGNKAWDKTYGGDQGDGSDFVSIDVTTSGGYIIGGGSSNSGVSGEKTQSSRGGDFWVIVVDKNGKKLWDKTLGGDMGESLGDLQTTTDGGYILGGFSSSDAGIDKSENGKGGYDYWIIKLDSSGNKLWDRTFGGSSNDVMYALEQTKDKGYVLAGHSYSRQSGDKTEPRRNGPLFSDYWVVKIDSLGQIEWNKTIGGSKDDLSSDIKQISGNNYIVAGASTSPKSGDKTLPRVGSFEDIWLVGLQVQPQAVIATESIDLVNAGAEKKFTAYPNPATDVLHIKTNGKESFSLSDQSGKIILTKTINGNGVINIEHLPAGIYYLKNIETKETEKILISK